LALVHADRDDVVIVTPDKELYPRETANLPIGKPKRGPGVAPVHHFLSVPDLGSGLPVVTGWKPENGFNLRQTHPRRDALVCAGAKLRRGRRRAPEKPGCRDKEEEGNDARNRNPKCPFGFLMATAPR